MCLDRFLENRCSYVRHILRDALSTKFEEFLRCHVKNVDISSKNVRWVQRDELMTPLLDYFKDEETEYMHYLRVLDSAVVNLGRSVLPVWEPFQGSIKPNPIASLPEQFTVSESKVTYVLQKEQSCMDSVHILTLTLTLI